LTTTMTARPSLQRTTIGQKVLMAGSGVVILLWVLAHMLGNLKVWLSASEFDSYAGFLRRLAEPPFPHTWALWIVRIGLIAAFAVHVYYAVALGRRSRRARVTRYAHTDHVQADPAALTMRWGGLTLAAFILFHLANFTWGWVHPGYQFQKASPYHNVVGTFGEWWMVILYALALFALALHTYHGTWSVFQTFGVNNRRWDRVIRTWATGISAFIFLGFLSVPVGVAAGAIK